MDDEEIVDIVDEENKVIGKSSRSEAHQKGHIHRALSVLVLNSQGKILLQKRSSNKSVHPLAWDLSTSEHVLSGETYEEAGIRSVNEELGVEVEVKRITEEVLQIREYEINGKIIYEKEIVLMLIAKHDGPFKIDQLEVDSVEFFAVVEIERMIEEKQEFTIWFLDEWENVKGIASRNNLSF